MAFPLPKDVFAEEHSEEFDVGRIQQLPKLRRIKKSPCLPTTRPFGILPLSLGKLKPA
jgi:hypothetical protein